MAKPQSANGFKGLNVKATSKESLISAEMEQRNSRNVQGAVLLRECKGLHKGGKLTDRGHCHLSRTLTWQLMAQRSSHCVHLCTLPSIPEYPGFQDIKDAGRTRPENHLNTSSVVQRRSPGCSGDHSKESHCKTRYPFCDKSLQDYFNTRLSELKNYEPKTCNGKMKCPPKDKQNPGYSSGQSRCQSNCNVVIKADHTKQTDEFCVPADQANKSMADCGEQSYVPNVEDCYERDCLDLFTTTVSAPLEMFLQEK